MIQGSLLGLIGVGAKRGGGTEGDDESDADGTSQNATRCPAVEHELDALANTDPYKQATWGLLAVDVESGEPVHVLNPDTFFVPGSTAKLVTVSAAWDVLGGDYRFRTPIYRTGQVRDGRLDGDLVLVASGDLTMGGRALPDDQIAYTSVDHTYANVIPGATLTEPDPLAGVQNLAQQVRDAGISRVEGNVIVDTRLFEDHNILDPETPLSPIILNDNLVDVVVSPTEPGREAKVTHRPETATYDVESTVRTVTEDEPTEIDISGESGGEILVSGQITAGSSPLVRVYQIEDPAAFARTALIEALEAVGVEVAASTVAPNPATELPPADYPSATQVAELVSPPFAEIAELILKTSHNLGANLMVCRVAVEAGSNDCVDGFAVIREYLERIDVDTAEVSLSDGRGGAREDFVTPRALVSLLCHWHHTPSAETFASALPILGVDGSLADVGTDSPAKGKVFAKTGTVAGPDYLNDRIFLTAHTLAGYIDTEDGRRLAFGLFMNHAGVEDIAGLLEVADELGEVAALIQQNC